MLSKYQFKLTLCSKQNTIPRLFIDFKNIEVIKISRKLDANY